MKTGLMSKKNAHAHTNTHAYAHYLHTYREYDRIVTFKDSLMPPVPLDTCAYEPQRTLT